MEGRCCRLNYVLEINAFERRMKRQPLPTTAQLLWYKLMAFANRQHWPEWFSIDNDRLAELLMTSEGTARSARDTLAKEGFILFERGVKRRPNRYKLLSIAEREYPEAYEDYREKEYEGLEAVSWEAEDVTRYFGYTEVLGSELRRFTEELYAAYLPGTRPTKQDERRVFQYIMHQEGEGQETVLSFPKENKELLAYAFEQASMAGAVNWHYIAGIYRKFRDRGIRSIEDAYDYDIRRDQQKGW